MSLLRLVLVVACASAAFYGGVVAGVAVGLVPAASLLLGAICAGGATLAARPHR